MSFALAGGIVGGIVGGSLIAVGETLQLVTG
jgi:hypothetical protein